MTVRPLVSILACLLATGCAMPFASKKPIASVPVDDVQGKQILADTVEAPLVLPATYVTDAGVTPTPPPFGVAQGAPSDSRGAAVAPRIVESSDAFRIGPEDVLDVQVWKNDELSRVVPVRPDGMISLPLVNDIRAAGLTAVELRQAITQRLAEYVPSPEVSVMVREVHSVKVAVLGAVRMPGHYEVKSAATVLELIARAQGLTEFADRGRIVVLRQNGGETTRIPFNYRKVAEGSEQDNFYVRPGDIIVVP
jgi:polysaccharide export outer membrane protein